MTRIFYEIPGGSIISLTGQAVVRVQVKNLTPYEASQIMDVIMDALEQLEDKWRQEAEQRNAELGLDMLRKAGVKLH